MIQESLPAAGAPAGQQLTRMRTDRRALARGQVLGICQSVIEIRDEPVEGLQPGPLGTGGDLLQALQRRSRRLEVPLRFEQRAEHTLERGAALAQLIQPRTI